MGQGPAAQCMPRRYLETIRASCMSHLSNLSRLPLSTVTAKRRRPAAKSQTASLHVDNVEGDKSGGQ